MVVVDSFVPCFKTFDASQVARLYFNKIVKLHVMPKTLTSDQDAKFAEVANRSLGDLMRSLAVDNPKQLELTLSLAEFAYNHFIYRTTGKSDERSTQIKELHQDAHLSLYVGDSEDKLDSRSSLSQGEKGDVRSA
uniref:Uncharacterized protein n=1 Tax=Tanacetum cinerariifolium TaxID=118510 RepID=A0A699K3G5_TANCI|nr:hypothetical protein [Tanacetum cinerariifolium]